MTAFKRPPQPLRRPIRGRHGPPPRLPPAPPAGPGGDNWEFHEGSASRPDLYPDRWVNNSPTSDQVAGGLADHIDGRDVRMSFNVEVKSDSTLKRRYQVLTPNVYVLGARINKAALLDLLARMNLPRVVETIRGYPRGTILSVSEVSIAEAWNG